MHSSSSKIQKKNLDSSPDDTREFEKGKVEIVNFGDMTIGRAIFEPGWSWSKCVKPIVILIVIKPHIPNMLFQDV